MGGGQSAVVLVKAACLRGFVAVCQNYGFYA
jgi:hypothetical protein